MHCTIGCISGPNGRTPNRPCVFPFTARGKTYSTCTYDHSYVVKSLPWCSTRTDDRGNHIIGNVGSCEDPSCPIPPRGIAISSTIMWENCIQYICHNILFRALLELQTYFFPSPKNAECQSPAMPWTRASPPTSPRSPGWPPSATTGAASGSTSAAAASSTTTSSSRQRTASS